MPLLVSTPLEWKELKKGIDRYSFTMETIKTRLDKKGDLWDNILDRKVIIANNKSLENF